MGNTVFGLGYVMASVVGAGGLQFLIMRKTLRTQLQASAEQAKAAADNSDVQSANVVQQMAMSMLAHKERELDECENERKQMRDVIKALVEFVADIPALPPMPAEIVAIVREWG